MNMMKATMKSIRITVGLLIALSCSSSLSAQKLDSLNIPEVMSSDWTEWGMVGGLNAGRYVMGEVGVYKSYVYELAGFPIASSTASISCEVWLDENPVFGPKVHFGAHVYAVDIGLNAIYYTSEGDYSLRFRPEFGFGTHRFSLDYGYNIKIVENDLKRINTHIVSFRFFIPFKRNGVGFYDRLGKEIKDVLD